MRKIKHAGVVLAIITQLLVFMGNLLLSRLNIVTSLSINELPYYINLILLILVVTLYLSFGFFHKKLTYFVLSVVIIQNLIGSAIIDLSIKSEDYDMFNDFSFLIAIPVMVIGVVFWGCIFDIKRRG